MTLVTVSAHLKLDVINVYDMLYSHRDGLTIAVTDYGPRPKLDEVDRDVGFSRFCLFILRKRSDRCQYISCESIYFARHIDSVMYSRLANCSRVVCKLGAARFILRRCGY